MTTRVEVKAAKRRKRRNTVFIGYCYKCGRDVLTDFCDACGIYVQPREPVLAPPRRRAGKGKK